MSQLYKTNPAVDYTGPVFLFGKTPIDTLELNFGTVASTANLTSPWNLGPNGVYAVVNQVIQQNATVEILGTLANSVSFVNGTTGNLLLKVFTSGANAEVGLQSAIQALGVLNTSNLSLGWTNAAVNLAGVTVTSFSL
jgi:hypothetical protein